jgi:hypothetical protein
MKNSNSLNTTLTFYNMIPNLIWSIINLTPIVIYCFTNISTNYIYCFLVISTPPIFLNKSMIDTLQIVKSPTAYKKLGVLWINKVTQNGELINKLINKRYPGYKAVTTKKSSISGLISQTYMFEKFHLVLFLFFTSTIVYSLMDNHIIWACIIIMTNIIYNIYPILLQQYIRLKLRLHLN